MRLPSSIAPGALLLGLLLVGCITRTEVVKVDEEGNPISTNVVHAADEERIDKTVDTLEAANDATEPVNPYHKPVGAALKVGGIAAVGISTLIAGWWTRRWYRGRR